MKSEDRRRPDNCPRHPDAEVVRTITGKSLDEAHWQNKYLFRQYECGNGCEEPLGWEFHGPKGEFRSGPGRCENEDPALIHRMAMSDYDTRRTQRSTVISALGCTSAVVFAAMGAAAAAGGSPSWEFAALGMTVTVVASAIAIRWARNTGRRERPPDPSPARRVG